MSTTTIKTPVGAINLPMQAVEFLARLTPATIDISRGAFAAIGLWDQAESWALRALAAQRLQDDLGTANERADVFGGDTPDAAAIRPAYERAQAEAAEAWEPLQAVVDAAHFACAHSGRDGAPS